MTTSAQELVPASYTPAPTGVNLVSIGTLYNSGDFNFVPTLPITDASAEIGVGTFSYARTFGLAGQSANITAIAPFLTGEITGLFLNEPASAERTGFGDLTLRFAINLYGGPAMSPVEFRSYRPKTLVGTSLTVKAPTGQYDSEKLINIGTNRWSFKPEVGVVQVIGKWALDAYVGAWFYTDNDDFFGGMLRQQAPIFSAQVHVRRAFSPKVWAAVDANFWYGGETSVNGVENDDFQRNSRVGFTVAWKVTRAQALRFAMSRGAITRIGGDFDSIGVSYSYSWMRRP